MAVCWGHEQPPAKDRTPETGDCPRQPWQGIPNPQRDAALAWEGDDDCAAALGRSGGDGGVLSGWANSITMTEVSCVARGERLGWISALPADDGDSHARRLSGGAPWRRMSCSWEEAGDGAGGGRCGRMGSSSTSFRAAGRCKRKGCGARGTGWSRGAGRRRRLGWPQWSHQGPGRAELNMHKPIAPTLRLESLEYEVSAMCIRAAQA